MRNIVISAPKIFEAGPLSILTDCLSYLSKNLSSDYKIIALVHRKNLVDIPNIVYYEFPDAKRSWLRRFYYEYVYFKKLSQKLKPYLWFSLEGITPNAKADILAVYCHNVCSFGKIPFCAILFEWKLLIFKLSYNYLYKNNIRKNSYVVVQQDWIRQGFRKAFGIDNVVVAHPVLSADFAPAAIQKKNDSYRFFYPSFPRAFKNIEVICEAAKHLADNGIKNFEILLTIDGKETRYSRFICNKYRCIPHIKFIGLQTREKIFELYNEVDCMIFPSKLESWGLPVTEFKFFNKPILISDLEYSHETAGSYDKVKFFNPDDAARLSDFMHSLMKNQLVFDKAIRAETKPPFASNWEELFDILLKQK